MSERHSLDDFRDPFQPEPARPAYDERRHAQETLAEEPQGIEFIAPEMDVRDVDQPQRSVIDGVWLGID